MTERLPQGWHVCQWCRSKHAGQFYQLVPGEWYCVECAASRMFKAGQLSQSVLDKNIDYKMQAIEDVLDIGFDVTTIEVNKAVEELKRWINQSEKRDGTE